jgi:hypothetical protein
VLGHYRKENVCLEGGNLIQISHLGRKLLVFRSITSLVQKTFATLGVAAAKRRCPSPQPGRGRRLPDLLDRDEAK